MRHFLIFISIALILTACNNITSRDKYQIATSTDGNVYRLDKFFIEHEIRSIVIDFQPRLGHFVESGPA
jgi:hypothetical protein